MKATDDIPVEVRDLIARLVALPPQHRGPVVAVLAIAVENAEKRASRPPRTRPPKPGRLPMWVSVR